MFLFVVGLDCVDNGLGAGFYLVCDRAADGDKVVLVLGPWLVASRGL